MTSRLATSPSPLPRSGLRRLIPLLTIYGGSRAVGLAREIGVAYYFGTSAAADRLNATFVVASLATIVLGEAVYAGCVQSLAKAGDQRDGGEVDGSTYQRLLRSSYTSAVIGAGAYCIAGPLLSVAVLGEWQQQTIVLSLLLAPSVAAAVTSGCVNARLTIEGRIALMTGAQILYSTGAVVGIVVIALSGAGPEAVAIGWSVGNVAAFALIYLLARPPRGLPALIVSGHLNPFRVGLPVAAAFTLVALQGLTDRAVAARLGSGSVAALGYADRLFLLPTGFVLVALGPLVLGSLTAHRAAGLSRVSAISSRQVRLVAGAAIPLGLLITAFSPLLVSAVFEYGAFNGASASKTVGAFDGFCVGLGVAAISLLLFRAMQAQLPLRTLAIVAGAAAALNAILTISLGAAFGLFGVTLATSFVALATALVQSRLLALSLDPGWGRSITRSVLVPLSASFVAALTLVLCYREDVLGSGARAAVGAALAVLAAALLFVQRPILRPEGEAR